MKIAVRIHLYFILIAGCLAVAFSSIGYIRGIVVFVGTVLFFWGWLRIGRFCGELEKSLSFSGDFQKMVDYSHTSGNAFLKCLAADIQSYVNDMELHYTAKVEDKQSRLNSSLQSQINPHFLYNTLECIRSEAVYQGCDSVANMTKALASFFRYGISRRETVVTIRSELENIQNYIMIQNYRFEDKFHFEVAVEEGSFQALSCQIPRMTIQPIVENCIFHGLEMKNGECHITISLRMTETLVLLMVSDNGVGMNEKQLKKLCDKVEHGNSEKKERENGGNGIALYNVNQRIKLLFGDDYGLHIYSIEGEGTDVEIQLPICLESVSE